MTTHHRRARRRPRSRSAAWALGTAFLLIAGCAAPPVSVKRLDPRKVHGDLARNVLSSGTPSNSTDIVLRRHDLTEAFARRPESALAALHAKVTGGLAGNDEIFALAELSFLHAEHVKSRSHYLAAVVYAYAFLFPEKAADRIDPIDPRVRVACDVYNLGIARAFATADGDRVELRGGELALPFGTMSVRFDEKQLHWGQRKLVDFIPSAELEVRGLRNRYRRAGLGAPLAARTEPLDPNRPLSDFVAPKVRVPATAVLTIDPPKLGGAALGGTLDLYTADKTSSVTIEGREVPLESDPSAALATALSESRFWESELRGLLGKLLSIERATRLAAREPYRKGQIPVVFVHGTGSSPGRWADMVNDLDGDPAIRRRFQFWFFTYDSGNPIAYSSMVLRQSLEEAVANLDPSGQDECLRQMVVIGHSQGGLLTKMTAVHSGDVFWANVSSEPFAEAKLSDKTRKVLEEALFVDPLPFVKRLIFIATPHGGSYLAGPQLVRRLAERFIQLPSNLLELSAEMVQLKDPTNSYMSLERIPTSIDNMSPRNPFIKKLSSLPIDPGCKAHSIIPVKGTGPFEGGDDGVVKYQSAHIEGVESELIVRSAHSTQSNPHTVEEVRRILHLHAEGAHCDVDAPAPQDESSPAPQP